MTDRELLELAAKAAGIDLYVWGSPGAENFANMASPGCRWNPLNDDGDALRLGVKVKAFGHPDFTLQLGIARFAMQDQDDVAAYRRAIVCIAAASIGEKT